MKMDKETQIEEIVRRVVLLWPLFEDFSALGIQWTWQQTGEDLTDEIMKRVRIRLQEEHLPLSFE